MALVPAEQVVTALGTEPVVVHLTVCKAHVRPARKWLASKLRPGDEVDTWGTELVLAHWDQVTHELDGVPILRRDERRLLA